MRLFDCPYLETKVELTDEREAHITRRHPDLLPAHLDAIADTLATNRTTYSLIRWMTPAFCSSGGLLQSVEAGTRSLWFGQIQRCQGATGLQRHI